MNQALFDRLFSVRASGVQAQKKHTSRQTSVWMKHLTDKVNHLVYTSIAHNICVHTKLYIVIPYLLFL